MIGTGAQMWSAVGATVEAVLSAQLWTVAATVSRLRVPIVCAMRARDHRRACSDTWLDASDADDAAHQLRRRRWKLFSGRNDGEVATPSLQSRIAQ